MGQFAPVNAGFDILINEGRIYNVVGPAQAKLMQPVKQRNRLVEDAEFIDATDEQLHEAELHQISRDLIAATGNALWLG